MKRFGKHALVFLRIVLSLLLLLPISYAIYYQWYGVQSTLQSIQWRRTIFSLMVQIMVLPLMGIMSWTVLTYLGQQKSLLKVTMIYFLSQAVKYLPGGIWAFPGRVIGYRVIGVDKVCSVISLVREVSVLFLGAVIIGLFGLYQDLQVEEWIRLAIIIGVVVSILAIMVAQLPWFWRTLSKIGIKTGTKLDISQIKISDSRLNWLPVALLVSFAFWLFTGLAFKQLAVGVTVYAVDISWFHAAAIFGLAWCAGFVMILVPAGLGIRETALSILLTGYMPLSEALSVALVARLWWTLAEVGYILVSLVWATNGSIWKDMKE